MLNKILHFIKYNNATVFIVLIIFIVGSGVFAAETGALGERQTRIEGVDNTLLLAADLDNFDMDYRIGDIKEDSENYYVVYTYIDLVEENNAWQYLMRQKTRKVSKKLKKDLGVYLAEELGEDYSQRIKDLKKEQKKALNNGEETRVEVVEYSGLLGKAFDLTQKAFPGYQPTGKRVVASPIILPADIKNYNKPSEQTVNQIGSENLVDVYNNYIQTHVNEIAILDGVVATSSLDMATSTDTVASSTDVVVDILLEPSITPLEVTSTISADNSIIDATSSSGPDVIVIDLSEITISQTSSASSTTN